ncbi:MAG: 40S ribosomal protein S3a/S1 [Nanoarchaeota archaeon]|nr:40S ribosomal protein S3a/S1 [Nanoarchaeota archaeon]MBU1103096.1 40S ribosomal protein S3a/S1 [Nanoarchaeota archaeon]
MAKQQKIKTKKTAKKSFYEVEAPLTSTKIHLYGASKEELEGKTIKLDLTKSLRGKNLELKLRVEKDGEKLQAIPKSTQLVSSYLKRVMRKGTDYAESSFETECKDCVAKAKILLVTRKRVSRVVLKTLRENAQKHLSPYIKTRNAEEIFSEIISNKLQKQLAAKLKKIYPLALCEIRIFEVLRPLKEKKE